MPLRIFATLWAALALLLAIPAAAQPYPARPDGPVLDAANVLPPAQETALDAKLREYNRTTGRAVVVATVTDLGGQPIDTYAQQLAETWGIGGAETEEAALLLVAPTEREVFIATARGVQGRLTDVASGRIVREVIIPAFRNGDMAGGIVNGTDAIIERLNMDPATAAAIDEAAAAARQQDGEVSAGTVVSAIFWIALLLVFMVIFGRRGARGSRHGAGSAVGQVVLWTAINAAMNSGRSGGSDWGGGSGGGGGFGGFGGGGGGFNGGGAGGSW